MSFGFSPSDIFKIVKIATQVYKIYTAAPAEFRALSDQVQALKEILEQAGEAYEDAELTIEQKERLRKRVEISGNILEELNCHIAKHKGLANPSRTLEKDWRRLRWSQETARDYRDRISTEVLLLSSLFLMMKSAPKQQPTPDFRFVQVWQHNGIAIHARQDLGQISSGTQPLLIADNGQRLAIMGAENSEGFVRELAGAGLSRVVLQTVSSQAALFENPWNDSQVAVEEVEDVEPTRDLPSSPGPSPSILSVSPPLPPSAQPEKRRAKSFFSGLGRSGTSLEVGFGGATAPMRRISSTGSADTSLSRTDTNSTKDSKRKKLRPSLTFSSLGSSAPSISNEHSPFGRGMLSTVNTSHSSSSDNSGRSPVRRRESTQTTGTTSTVPRPD